MELLQLRYLCTAARYENFSRAARHHNIPQSAISKTIAQLERELGVRLFLRKGNRVTLSDAGKKYCREVQQALDILGDAARELRGGDGALHGEVHILVEEHYGAVLRLLSDFRATYPNVQFSISRRPDADFDYDLRISATSRLGDRLGFAPLRDVEVGLLLPTMHRLTEWERVPIEALREERLVALLPETPAAAAAASVLRASGITLPVALACDDPEMLCGAVGAGVGIAFSSGISPEQAGEGIALRALTGKPIGYPTCLSWRRTLSPAAEAFTEAILARLAPPAYSAKNG